MEPISIVSPCISAPPAAAFEPQYVIPSWGLSSVKAPPGLTLPSEFETSKQDSSSCTKTKRICFFQNRHHNAGPEETFAPCSRGEDCDFCHCFHPKMKRRNDPTESFCNCPGIPRSAEAHEDDRASESTGVDTSDTGLETSDDSSSVKSDSEDSSQGSWPADVPQPVGGRVREGRQICYFQNRFHHPKSGKTFAPCSKGDQCGCCHEMHPRIARRNDKTSRCNCPA